MLSIILNCGVVLGFVCVFSISVIGNLLILDLLLCFKTNPLLDNIK